MFRSDKDKVEIFSFYGQAIWDYNKASRLLKESFANRPVPLKLYDQVPSTIFSVKKVFQNLSKPEDVLGVVAVQFATTL